MTSTETSNEEAGQELWLQLVTARQAAVLTQDQLAERLGVSTSQVAKIEQRRYETYTPTRLRRYVAALGQDFRLEVTIARTPPHEALTAPLAT